MKFSYRLSKVCGLVYNNGNLIFADDGNSIVSPIGNRISVYDLVKHATKTLPFENRKNIAIIAISSDSRFLITVDVDGHALFINFPRQVVLHRFNFKRKVLDLKFSPDNEHFIVTFGNNCQIWNTPSAEREFSPLLLSRMIGGHHDIVTCVDWTLDSKSVILGSNDMSAKIYYNVHSKKMALTTLTGHRDVLVGVFFAESGNEAYTVARDGAIFTWNFEYSEASEAKKGAWKMRSREFLWEPQTQVSSVDFHKLSSLLVVGFDKGVFGLYQMPNCVPLHKLSVSHQSLNTVSINKTGEWLALGSSKLGQLVVWEWRSESYILKQQGHTYGLNSVDYSSDGHYIATGGEDSKVKLWNTSTGFCFVTLAVHLAAVTGVKFFGQGMGKGVLSCSLDGTVRAHDLLRYKNFRTLTTPTPVQFSSLAVDSAAEIVCAGSIDPFQIYVWSLQTGRLLDTLAGHEGPVACLDFVSGAASNSTSVLASGSWDGTLKLWNVYENKCIETFEHGCDVLACAFRPDGKEFCTCATNGCIYFWDVDSGAQLSFIDGRRDISGGRLSTDRVTADNSSRSKYFTTITYTADGTCVLAGGRSKYCCIYSAVTGVLIKKFQLSYNRSLEGIVDKLRSDRLVDGISLDNISDDENDQMNDELPGAKMRQDGSRLVKAEMISSCIRFSNNGSEWAAATSQGLQVFSLDEAMLFAPTDLNMSITPEAVLRAISQMKFGLAINMALHLREQDVLKKAVDAVPLVSIDTVAPSIEWRLLRDLLSFIANEMDESVHIEYYLQWTYALLIAFHRQLEIDSKACLESIRMLIRIISKHEKDFLIASDKNQFMLTFLTQQLSV